MSWRTFQLSLLLFAIHSFVACSQVKFSTEAGCESKGSVSCIVENGFRVYSGQEVVKGGKVDVLIVNDNSASMSYEQARLSSRFSRFVELMDGKSIDYRLALTTTDISSTNNRPRTINLDGALQDGRLITLRDGAKYLTSESGSSASRIQIFNQAIKRPETLACEKFILDWIDSGKSVTNDEYQSNYYNSCPSTDERGIYASNLVVQNNPDGFIRTEADLAIIILSDEDERSQLYWNNTAGFTLEDLDKAPTLVSQVKTKYPQKKFAVHSIITKDASCLAVQNSQTRGVVSGSYGWEYYKASQLTGGVSGNICSDDYTGQLTDIFNNLSANIVDRISLSCAQPQELKIQGVNIPYQIKDSQIVFAQKLPVGTLINYSYKCPDTAK